VKVVTWNIQFGREIEQATRDLTEQASLADTDVLLVQELDEAGAQMLARALGGYHFEYVAASVHPRTGRQFGNAVLSPTPLHDREVIELPHKARFSGQPRVALKVVASIDGVTTALCSTHTEIPALGSAKRQDQFAALADAASAWSTERAIIGGDFNTVSKRGVRSLVARFDEAGFAHVSPRVVATVRRAGRGFTLDHVFARGLTPTVSGVVHDAVASDHSPVWVTLAPTSVTPSRRTPPEPG